MIVMLLANTTMRRNYIIIKEDYHISNQMKKYEELDKKIYNLESTGMFEN